ERGQRRRAGRTHILPVLEVRRGWAARGGPAVLPAAPVRHGRVRAGRTLLRHGTTRHRRGRAGGARLRQRSRRRSAVCLSVAPHHPPVTTLLRRRTRVARRTWVAPTLSPLPRNHKGAAPC